MKHGHWRKSSASGTSNCVEIALSESIGTTHSESSVLIRNTRDHEHVLSFTEAEWKKFLAEAGDGKFDLSVLPKISPHETAEP